MSSLFRRDLIPLFWAAGFKWKLKMKWEKWRINSDYIYTAADKILKRDLGGSTAIWLAIKTTWTIWNSANWDKKYNDAWQEGRHSEKVQRWEHVIADQFALYFFYYLWFHFTQNNMPCLTFCSIRLTICCFLLICSVVELHSYNRQRLSNCTFTSAEMKKWNEQKPISRQIHFVSAKNETSLSLAPTEM